MTQMNLSAEQKQTHRHVEQTSGCQGGGGGNGMDWEFGVGRCRLLHLEGIGNEVLYIKGSLHLLYPTTCDRTW